MNLVGFFLPLILMFGVFYFLIIKPQNKEKSRLYELQSNLKKGDKVVTNAGIVGVVEFVLDQEDAVVIKSEGSKLKLKREVIMLVENGDEFSTEEAKKEE